MHQKKSLKKTYDHDLDEFRHVLKKCDDIFFEIYDKPLEEYVKAGMHNIGEISQLHKEYLLKLAKGIDFENASKPFGVAKKNFEMKSENELRGTLYFHDLMNIPLFEFLNNTTVGNLSLAKELIFLRKNVKFEILRIQKTRAIREKNMENRYVVERLKQINATRHLNYAEGKKIIDIIIYQLRNMSYAIVILKPLKIIVLRKDVIEYREFYIASGLLNRLIALLEFIEYNSQLCHEYFKT
ncbi:hypothetical protein C922_00424 [Plasmodium inui San Antonio 1]|uniref:Uncharacterized protein n=1 Tax=Plasmodium inui San Antonio 1 TaxID=1237626 RepID=W7ACY3_9APIC|nr:hypothetical protein C922_00424 [Plasmodium inui San Antonio 1]EUD69560.1 hypothetical protein C922_00424 [Plasmodium inui San Antonio 1]